MYDWLWILMLLRILLPPLLVGLLIVILSGAILISLSLHIDQRLDKDLNDWEKAAHDYWRIH